MNAYEREIEKKTAENKNKPLIIHIPMCKELCTQAPMFDINVRIATNLSDAFLATWDASNREWQALVDFNKRCCLYISYATDKDGNYWGLVMPTNR